jgi:hypothetical protein
MSAKGEASSTLRRCTLAVIIACSGVWWTSTGALAQEGLGSGTEPHLVTAMITPEDTQLYDSQDAVTQQAPTASNDGSCKAASPAAYASCAKSTKTGTPLMASASNESAGQVERTGSRAKPMFNDVETSTDLARAKGYTLLSNSIATETFRYEYPKKQFMIDPSSAAAASAPHEFAQAPRPLFQVAVGHWHLPVMLSTATSE